MFILDKNSIDFFRSFNFKNLKSFNTHDGIAYSCELYHNRFKIADVMNHGDGGMTSIDYTEGGEEYFDNLNVKKYHDKDLGFDNVDNEYTISDLVETAISVKKALSKQSKSIVYIVGESIYTVTFKHKFSDILKANRVDVIQNQIDKVKKEGGTILNTNLNKLGFNV